MAYTLIEEPTVPQKKEESLLGTVARNVYKGGEKALATALGGPGDVASGVQSIVDAITGVKGPEQPLPTSESITENYIKPFTKKFLPESYSEPQSQATETLGDVGSFITGVFTNPLNALGKASKGFSAVRRLGNAIAGELGAKGAEALGGGPVAQAAGRIGSTFLTSRFGGRSQANKQMKTAYDTATKEVKGKVLSPALSTKLFDDAKKFSNDLGERITDDKKFLKDSANAIKKVALSETNVPVEKIWNLKRDLNNHLGSLKDKNSTSAKLTRDLLGKVNGTLQSYAKINPEFGTNFNLAEDIFKGMNAADDVSRFVLDNTSLAKIAKSPLTKLIAFNISPGKTIGGIGSALGIKELYKYRDLLESPKAQKIYSDLFKGALEQNTAQFIKGLKASDKLIENYDSKGHKVGKYILLD